MTKQQSATEYYKGTARHSTTLISLFKYWGLPKGRGMKCEKEGM